MILNLMLLRILLLSTVIHFADISPSNNFKKIVIWGHKLHSHTHSFIHYGFFKAFQKLDYDTYWFDNSNDVSNFDFDNCLIITEGQEDQNLPLCDNAFYVLHNCDYKKYEQLHKNNKCILLQVYTNDCHQYDFEKLEDCIYIDKKFKTLIMPWATDLLPEEIDEVKKNISNIKKESKVYFIGTFGKGLYGNLDEIKQFEKACQENYIPFIIKKDFTTTATDNKTIIQTSLMAPAIQGKWQCQNGYIPCRIFKNISYGQLGITNSKTVYDLFKGKIVYNSDTYQLFYDAQKKLKNLDINEIYEQMDFVRDNHTYINRIKTILDFINIIKSN